MLTLEEIQLSFKPREFESIVVPGTFPFLRVRVPDEWPYIDLVALFDVHIGNPLHDEELRKRHFSWLADQKYVIGFNGGDLFENIVDLKMGHTRKDNTEQYYESIEAVAPFQHKLMFSIPGNHEARTYARTHIDIARILADNLRVPYFPDYAFVSIEWRGNRFKLAAHHGTGTARTAGAQRMAARQDLPWMHPDIMWTGHLHQPLNDYVEFADVDQRTGDMFWRTGVVLISPSYLHYFGGYAASRRLGPGPRGLVACTLHFDGRIDVTSHARGKRL